MFKHLLMPFEIGSLKLRNRMIMAPMATGYGTIYGDVTTKLIEYHRKRAEGGVALNIVEFASVSQNGRMFPNVLGIFSDSSADGFKALVAAIHESGGKAAFQIGHGGRRVPFAVSGMRPIAPSPIPSIGGEMPREMSLEDIKSLQEDFVRAALRAKSAGSDAIELNMCHGYLLHQFLSPLSNKRVDEYGDEVNGRAKFAVDTLRLVKEAVGRDFPVFCRISAEERVTGGITIKDSIRVAKLLEDSGADALHVSAGMLETAELVAPPMAMERGCYSHYAEAIKKNVSVPVIAVGRINSPDIAERILEEGKADLIAMGRPLIADHEFPKKVMENRANIIRPCIACNQGCIKRLYQNLDVTCTVNALVGIEKNFEIVRSSEPKSVLIVGGGPAGLKCAKIASLRGHRVTVIEKKGFLGGRFAIAGKMPHRSEIAGFIRYMERTLKDQKVEIHLNKPFQSSGIKEKRPDVLVLATGSEPIIPDIKGLDKVSFVMAEDVPDKKGTLGQNIAVIGAGEVGCEIAEFLALEGKRVILLEELDEVAKGMESRTRKLLLRRLSELKVNIIRNAKVTAVEENRISFTRGNVPNQIDGIDSFVIAVGYHVKEIEEAIEGTKEVIRVLDIPGVRDALQAIHLGCQLGFTI